MSDEVGLETLVTGFRQAAWRFTREDTESHLVEDSAERAFLPLFEALNWLVAIDDYLRERAPDALGSDTRGGELLRAVRFARNRVHHQWAAALRRSRPSTATMPDGWGTSVRVRGWERRRELSGLWQWRNQLPEPRDERYRDAKGQKLYEKHLAGKAVQACLQNLEADLTALWA